MSPSPANPGTISVPLHASFDYLNGPPELHSSICNSHMSVTTTIAIYSSYGNIPSLGMIDGSFYAGSSSFSASSGSANLTFVTNAGNGTLYECSNQGTCNRNTGLGCSLQLVISSFLVFLFFVRRECECLTLEKYGKIQYRAVSSDGHVKNMLFSPLYFHHA